MEAPIDEKTLAEWEADQGHGPFLKGRVKQLLREVRRLQAVALTFEDEADRLGGEVKRLREVEAAARRVFEGKAELPALWATLDPLPDVGED